MNTADNATALFWYDCIVGMMEAQMNLLLDQVLEASDLMTFEFPDDMIDGPISKNVNHVYGRTEPIDTTQKEALVQDDHDASEQLIKGVAVRYKCNLCNNTYASTDGISKHYRKRHPEVVRRKGKPRNYCVAVANV